MILEVYDLSYNVFFCINAQFSHSVMSDSLQPHGLQLARLPCPSPTPRVYSTSCPSSQWCHSLSHPCPPLLLPSIFPRMRVFSSVLHIRWPKYWSFSFSISPSNPLIIYFTYSNVYVSMLLFHFVPPCSPLTVSTSLFSMSLSSLLNFQWRILGRMFWDSLRL